MSSEPASPQNQKDSSSRVSIQANRDISIGGNFIGGDNILNQAINLVNNTLNGPQAILTPRQRKVLLDRVEHHWIKGVLEQATAQLQPIQLTKQLMPEAVLHPWSSEADRPTAPKTLTDQPLAELFDPLGQALLILGAPGSGKTISLLELTRELIRQARQDDAIPMPVVLTLAAWAERQSPILDWLTEELSQKYQIPVGMGRECLSRNLIIPLLDGLDEVPTEARGKCITAINTFRQQHGGMTGLVVCCRTEAYQLAQTRLQMDRAVLIQPLRLQQITEYLNRGGKSLTHLRQWLANDPGWQELAQSPLMLNVMSAVFDQIPEASQPTASVESQRTIIFEAYVSQMLKSRAGHTSYAPEQARQWLQWLAGRMNKFNLAEVWLDQIQPFWMETRPALWAYALSSRLLGCLLAMIGLASLPPIPMYNPNSRNYLAHLAVQIGFTTLVSGLTLGAAYFLQLQARCGLSRFKFFNSRLWQLIAYVGGALILSWALLAARRWTWPELDGGWLNSMVLAIIGTLVFGSVLGFVFGLNHSKQDEIRPTLRLSWSWRITLVGAGVGGLAGFIVAVVINGLERGSLLNAFALNSTLTWALLFGAIFGVRQAYHLTTRSIRRLWRSALNALIAAGLWYLGAWAIVYISQVQVEEPLKVAVGFLCFALLGWVHYGGMALMQHALLRFWLWRLGCLPWQSTDFLDFAAERRLLHKTGGGYIFLHRYLLEHFATHPTPAHPPDMTSIT